MQTRCGDENSFRPSVCPFVCLSVTRYLNFWLFNILRQALACSVIHNCMDQLIRPERPGPEIQYNHLVEELIVEFKSGVELSLFDQIRHRCLSAALRGSPGRDDTPDDPQNYIRV